MYAAILVDLPCILESMKTLDKKNIFKTADVCQMLLVKHRIQREEEVMLIPDGNADTTYPHGLTPPMHWVRKRRFRKRVSTRTIEAVEQEVERLLRDDDRAEETRYETITAEQFRREEEVEEQSKFEREQRQRIRDYGDDNYDDDEDAEGEVEEVDYGFGGANGGDDLFDDTALAEDLEAELMGLGDDDDDGDVKPPHQPTGGNSSNGGGGQQRTTQPQEDEDSDEDDADGEDDADVMVVEQLDEAALEKKAMRERIMQDMEDLRESLNAKQRELMGLNNNMLRNRCMKVMEGFQRSLEIKENELAALDN